jgi:hypothetical protein
MRKVTAIALGLLALTATGIPAEQDSDKESQAAKAVIEKIGADFRDACTKVEADFEKRIEPFRKDKASQIQKAARTAIQRLEAVSRGAGKAKTELIQEMANKEIEGIKQTATSQPSAEPSGIAEIVGTWKLTSSNRTYVIAANGKVHFPEEKKDCNLQPKDGFFLLDFGDGKLDRVHTKGGILYAEHYNPKTLFPKGSPAGVSIGNKASK